MVKVKDIPKRVQIPLYMRIKVLERENYTCIKCHRIFRKNPNHLEIHHIKPVVYGGTNDFHNLVAVCYDCHNLAPNTPLEFGIFLSKRMTPEHEQYLNISIITTMMVLNKLGFINKNNFETYYSDIAKEVKQIYQEIWDCRVHKNDELSLDILNKLLERISIK